MSHPIDPMHFKVLDQFLDTIDLLSEEDAAMIRMAIFNFIKPRLTPTIGQAIKRNGKNPPVIASNLVVRRMIGNLIVDEGVSEALLVQAIVLVVRDQLRSYVDEIDAIHASRAVADLTSPTFNSVHNLKVMYDSLFEKFFTFENVIGMGAEHE